MILRKLAVGPYASNCYIVGSEESREGIVIDPGDEAHKIIKNIKELTIKIIVLTHGHHDHTGALRKVREATGAPVAIHAGDAGALPGKGGAGAEDEPAVRLLKGGDAIDFGGEHFVVLHTPGHSPGSICLLGTKVVFTGDTLFNFGIGRYDLTGGSYSQIMNSLHTKLMVLPDDTAVYPGHGPDTTIGMERRRNPFLTESF